VRHGLQPKLLGWTAACELLRLMPLAAGLCRWLSLPNELALAACFYCALPTAPNADSMARQMGGDARLMASAITLQTALALASVPLSLYFLAWLP
jgi:malonate transporter